MWDCCSAAEGFVLSRGIPGDEETQHFKAQGCPRLPGISLLLLLCNPGLCFPASQQAPKARSQRAAACVEEVIPLRGCSAGTAQHCNNPTAVFPSQESLEKTTASKEAFVCKGCCVALAQEAQHCSKEAGIWVKEGIESTACLPPPEGRFGESLGTGRDPCSRAAWGTSQGWSHPTHGARGVQSPQRAGR